jgi:hypothetical protein
LTTGMSIVDLVLIGLALVFAFSGFAGRHRLGHLLLRLLRRRGARCPAVPSGCRPLDGTATTRVFARWSSSSPRHSSGRLLAGAIGRAVRRRVTWQPAEVVDSVAGAVPVGGPRCCCRLDGASPLANAPFPQVASQVKQSALVQAVDRSVPDGVRVVYDSLREAIDRNGLPDVLDPLTPTQVPDVPRRTRRCGTAPVVGRCRARWCRSAASRRRAPGRSTAPASSTRRSG